MKNSIYIFLFMTSLLCSFLISCVSNTTTDHDATTKQYSTDSGDECFSSYRIFGETAYLWQSSWVSYYNAFKGGEYENAPYIKFDRLSLDSLYSEVEGESNAGVLLYYILLDSLDPYPSLVMRNTVSCQIDQRGTILMSPYDHSGATTITKLQFKEYKTEWDTISSDNTGVIYNVSAYNYSWNTIWNIVNENPISNDLYIRYGLRTISPNEYGFAAAPDSIMTGQVIYCNVIYGSQMEESPSTSLHDFVMPCPTYCGS